MPKISIIVPVYKVEKYLNRCVDSILAQTFRDFELIMIDDGSPDNCGLICDEYARKDKRIQVLHQKNGGVSSARNYGLDIANGEYIMFVDSDDWIHPQMLELLYHAVITHNSKLSICSYKSATTYKPMDSILDASISLWNTEELYVSMTINAIVPWAKLFHTSLLKSVRFPLNVRFEDERTIYKALFQTTQIPYVNHPLYFYFTNPDGFMNTRHFTLQMDVIPAYEEPLCFFEEAGFEKAFNVKINDYFHVLTKMIQSVSFFSSGSLSTKTRLHKKRWEVFRRMNFGQRSRVCNELHPHIMGIYWRLHTGIRMIFHGDWINLFRRIRNKIRR